MGLSKEISKPKETRTDFSLSNPSFSEREVNIFPVKERRAGARISELSQMLFAESKKEKNSERQPETPPTDGFEPFINGSENSEHNLFVNLYGGDFAQKMQLNRKGVERVLKIAHLDGQVFLTNLPSTRQRSAEAQGDELAAKRFLFFGEKREEDGKDNPLYRVVSVPQGWRIQVNDTGITEELTEKKIGGRQLQRAFIRRFNGAFKKGLFECIWREKMSSEKDKNFRAKLIASMVGLAYPTVFSYVLEIKNLFISFPFGLISVLTWDVIFHLKYPGFRKLDGYIEFFMPLVEIDKVVTTFAYLQGKGKTLVRETREEK